MANYGGQTLVFELPSQPERVWDALTDPSALNQWFGQTNLLARAGLPFSLRPHAGGDLPAGAGEVVAVEPPRRLVLRWRAAGRVLALTILVEPGPGGSVLRVAHSDTGGIDESRSAGLRRLYDERLRAFLAGMPMPDPAPVVDPVPRAPHPGVAAPGTRPIQPAADPVRTPAPTRRRAVVPVAIGGVALVVLVLVAWTVAGASFTWGAPGADGSPTAPASQTATATRAAASAAAVTPVTTTVTAGPTSVSPTSGASGPLTVASRVTNRQPNSLTVVVTITNRSDAGQTWRNVGVDLSSANLTLSNVDSRVNYDWAGTRACFTPGPVVTTVAGGGTVTFPFTVTGAGPGDVTATSLNHPACS
jgi:uncharacterized protein YndB with AHSA1/START domain